jgi:hypothetical protein
MNECVIYQELNDKQIEKLVAIEIRQVQEFEDFPAEVRKAANGYMEMKTQSQHRKTDKDP